MDPRQRTQLQDTCEVPGFPNRARTDEARFRNERTSRRREDLDSNHPRQSSSPASGPSSRTRQWRINVPGIRHRSRRESNRGKCVPHNSFLAGRKCGGEARDELIGASSMLDTIKEVFMAAQQIPLAGLRTKLLSRSNVAEGTMAFHFAKPSGFSFKAGQAADLYALIRPKPTQKEILELSQLPAHPLKVNSRFRPECGTRHSNGR